MKKVVLEGSRIIDKETLHRILKSELSLPIYYGENLDALWDCLTAEVKLPLIIEWREFETSKEFLGEYAERAAEVFRAAERTLEGKLEIRFSGEGEK